MVIFRLYNPNWRNDAALLWSLNVNLLSATFIWSVLYTLLHAKYVRVRSLALREATFEG